MKILLSINYLNELTRLKRGVALMAKRYKQNDGTSAFSEIAASLNEESLYMDLISFSCENLVSVLEDIAKSYYVNDNEMLFVFEFAIEEDDADSKKMQTALRRLVTGYVYNYAISRYLRMIRPDANLSAPYDEQSEILIKGIKRISYSKYYRKSNFSYKHIKAEVI